MSDEKAWSESFGPFLCAGNLIASIEKSLKAGKTVVGIVFIEAPRQAWNSGH